MNLLKKITRASEKEIFLFVKRYLEEHYSSVKYIPGQYIIAEGDIPIALIAHLDTVFETLKTPLARIDYRKYCMEFFYDGEQKVLWSPDGAGFDDRAGVYAIVRIIESGLRPHVIFTCGEESGGVGAHALVAKFPKSPFKNLKYMIELDRAGEEDCVFYECNNPLFTRYIENFGFKEDIGSFSDISILAPAWGVAAVNLSIGYVDEHSYVERLYFQWLNNTIDKVKNILSQRKHKKYKYIPYERLNVCIQCGNPIKRPIVLSNDVYHLCPQCANKYLFEK